VKKKLYFDEQIAAGYDLARGIFDPSVVDPAVSFLAVLAGSGGVLELGIGTGRSCRRSRGPRTLG
jgi:hypothetical protein